MPADELVCLKIRLYGNDNFFEQDLGFKFGFCLIALGYSLGIKPTGKKLLRKVMAASLRSVSTAFVGEFANSIQGILQLILKG